jgi:hypothetical protein
MSMRMPEHRALEIQSSRNAEAAALSSMRIPVKVATCYDPKRPAIPIETGHPI